MNDLWQDVKFGARMLKSRGVFTAVAVLTLALGIGANAAIFSAVNAILLERLPVGDPDRLVLFDDGPGEGTSSGVPIAGVWRYFSYRSYKNFAEDVPAFEALAAFRSGQQRLSLVEQGAGPDRAQLAQGHLVSGNYFTVLRSNALLGRVLSPEDDAPTAPPAAVISHGYWQTHFGGVATVIGRAVTLNGTSFTIVGVMPDGFFGTRVRKSPDFWIPLSFQPQIEQRESFLAAEDVYWLNLVGRLKPGSDLDQAQSEVNVALKRLLIAQAGATPDTAWRAAIDRASVRLVPGERGISSLRAAYAEPLRLLVVVTAIVLLIACANIANLLLSRATERRSEIAMRLALGATRWRLVRQLLTESLLLAGLGGAAGLLISQWGVGALKALVSTSAPVNVGADARVLSFTAGVTLLAGVLFGLAPALRAGRGDLASSIRERAETGGGGRLRPGIASGLVVTQVALSLVLLIGAGLLLRSLSNLARQDVGFTRDGVLLVEIDPRVGGLQTAELSGYYGRLLERVNRIPAARSATLANFSPMGGSRWTSNISVQGYTPPAGAEMIVDVNRIGPRYTTTLGLPLLLGREFTERDGPEAPKVALVNEAFAKAYSPGESVVGRRFGFGDDPNDSGTIEIVGVVGDARYADPRERPVRNVFLPLLQASDQTGYWSNIEIRTAGDPSSLEAAVREAVAEVDPRVPVAEVTTLGQQLADSMRRDKLLTRLVSAFGALAAFLACVGLYGVVAQVVARRTNEVGIRMALGAAPRDILSMVLREAGALILLGCAIGLPLAFAATRFIENQLFGLTAGDPLTYAGISLLLALVAVVAGYLPARRASRVDPIVALRME